MSQLLDLVRLPNFGLGVAKGQFQNISHIHRFCVVPAMSVNTTGTVWDVNDTIYPWSVWDSGATQLNIVCSDANDVGLMLHVEGLDSSYNVQTESTLITSATGQTTTKSYLRVNRMYVTDSGATNVGNIDLQYSTTTIARIRANVGQTMMGVYTIPAGHSAYILKGVATCAAGASGAGYFYGRTFNDSNFLIAHSFEFAGGSEYDYQFPIPLRMVQKTDIEVRTSIRSNNARVTAAFDLLLDKDD